MANVAQIAAIEWRRSGCSDGSPERRLEAQWHVTRSNGYRTIVRVRIRESHPRFACLSSNVCEILRTGKPANRERGRVPARITGSFVVKFDGIPATGGRTKRHRDCDDLPPTAIRRGRKRGPLGSPWWRGERGWWSRSSCLAASVNTGPRRAGGTPFEGTGLVP